MDTIGEVMNMQTIRSSREKNSDVLHCKNSEAIEKGLTKDKYEVKQCEFCGEDLEITGFYIPGVNRWFSKREYERCKCVKSIEHWKAVEEEEQRQDIREYEETQKREYGERLNNLLKNSQLGKRFLNRTFETFNINNKNIMGYQTCLRYAQKFNEIKDDGIGIIISGNYGTGKTHLVAAVAHELMRQGYQPIFGTLISLLSKVRFTYNAVGSKETEESIINSYINCSLLIIDDLGKEKPSEWVIEKLYQILNARYEDNKPIIVTTNYSMEKLVERLTVNNNSETAEAIVSRIYEMCKGVSMQGEDYRKQ